MSRISLPLGLGLALAFGLAVTGCDQKASSADGVTAASAPAVVAPASVQAPAASPAPVAPAVAASDNPDTENTLETGTGVDIGSIAIASNPGANGGEPVEVDFVLAFDPAAAQEIGKLSASAWFAKRDTYTVSDRAQVMSWIVSPGRNISEVPIDADGQPMGAFVFARYKSPGDHRQTVAGEGTLQVNLGPSDFTTEIVQ